jgi:predicted Zn-dependent peptidase
MSATSEITTRELQCGMMLLAERIPNVASTAVNWLVPAGSATDADDRQGVSTMLGELLFRGAGELNSRAFSDALDRLGVQRSSQTLTNHLQLGATMLGTRLGEALPLLVDMIRRPMMPDDAVDPVRSLCLQSLESLVDEPQHTVMLRLREQHLPPPFNRHGYGERAVLESTTGDELRRAWGERSVPGGAIFAAAGDVDADALARQLDELLAGWSGAFDEPAEAAAPKRGVRHIEQDTAQVHIGLAYDAPHEASDVSMLERLAVAVLSGSTSARLFTEVRQKRALCYSVGASYRAGRDRGLVNLYAGTTPQRAQETLDVCTDEIRRLREGVEADEFDRAVNGLKSQLVMKGESTAARAASLAGDYYRLGRPRTLDEVTAAIDAISLDELNAYIAERDFGPLTAVAIGPTKLRLREGEAAAAP